MRNGLVIPKVNLAEFSFATVFYLARREGDGFCGYAGAHDNNDRYGTVGEKSNHKFVSSVCFSLASERMRIASSRFYT